MIVELNQIPEEGLQVAFHEPVSLGAAAGCVEATCPVDAQVSLVKTGIGVAVRGRLGSTVRVTCSRCLEVFPLNLGEEFEVHYLPSRTADVAGEHELSPGDLDVLPLREDRIDLTALLQDTILLTLPPQPVCRETCRGLCPRCGASLNAGPCGCPPRPADPRWQALGKLRTAKSRS